MQTAEQRISQVEKEELDFIGCLNLGKIKPENRHAEAGNTIRI